MSRLAHALPCPYKNPHYAADKKNLDRQRQLETIQIRRIQQERKLTWSQAMAVYFYGSSALDPIIPNQESKP